MLTDPTSGAGYSTGQQLPSADMTTIATQQPNAIDGNNGGSYSLSGVETIAIASTSSAPIFALGHTVSAVPCVALDNSHATGITLYCTATGGGTALLVSGAATFTASSVTFSGAGDPVLGSRSVTRTQILHGCQASAEFAYSDGYAVGTRSGWLQTDKTNAGSLSLPIDNLVDNSTLTSVVVHVIGGLAAHAGLPATMPAINLIKVNGTTGAVTSLGTQTDSSGTAGAYDAAHTITVGSLSETITDEDRYVVLFTGETGANSVNNALLVFAVVANYTVTKLTPGG